MTLFVVLVWSYIESLAIIKQFKKNIEILNANEGETVWGLCITCYIEVLDKSLKNPSMNSNFSLRQLNLVM